MTKRNRKIALVIVYVLLIIGGVSLTDFAQSHAYFTTNNRDNPLKYQANVVNSYQDVNLLVDEDGDKQRTQVPLIFALDINEGVNTNTKDEYEVVVPDRCSVTRVSGSGASRNGNSFTLNKQANGSNTEYRTGSVTVEMTCGLYINENRTFKVDVFETVKGKRFKYATSNNLYLDYNKYVVNVSENVTSTHGPIKGNAASLFAEFQLWIGNYSTQNYKDTDPNNSDKVMADYIKFYAINENQGIFKNSVDFEKALNKAKTSADGIDKTTIPGISISYNASNDTYTYKIEENLLGYARTYDSSFTGGFNFIFYFDSKNEDVINEAFDYYLTNYIFNDGTVNISDAKKYIKTQSSNGVAGLVLNNTPILGIEKIGTDGYVLLKNDFITYMNATYPILVPYDTVRNMKRYINSMFSLKQISSIVSPEVIKNVMDNPLENRIFFETLFTGANATDEEKQTYNAMTYECGDENNPKTCHVQISKPFKGINYFVEYDAKNNRYAVFTVWSDGVRGNSIKVDTLALPAGFTVTAVNATIDNTEGVQLMFTPPAEGEYDYAAIYADVDEQLKKIFGVSELYESLTASSTHRHRVRILVEDILTDLNANTVYTPLINGALDSTRARVKAKKPTINTEPVIPPLEVENTSSKSGEDEASKEPLGTETSCKDVETGKDDTPVTTEPEESSVEESKEDESIEESTDEESTEEKINKMPEDTSSYPSNNVSDNPNKDEETESSLGEGLPKIK